MKTEIRPITVAEAFDSPAFEGLCNEYRSESLRNPHMLMQLLRVAELVILLSQGKTNRM